MKDNLFTVPEGYFDDLQQRLLDIPAKSAVVTPWAKVKPYMAMAAMLAAIITAGSLLFRSPAISPAQTEGDEEMYLSANPYATYSLLADSAPESLSEDDLIQYMIQSGINIDYYETDY